MAKFEIRETDGTIFPMPASEDVSTVCEVAKHISKGNDRFPSKVVMVMEEETDEIYVIYAFGKCFRSYD